ncbi:MAG: histidine phosphatase family protein [Elusimicrobia bacterium]|nr:histidine phosphatase family protein [Elusimicrobiota bacterium]MDE2313688.1 histidine phosphatase family protein [Elusimicrobiota bacterium]
MTASRRPSTAFFIWTGVAAALLALAVPRARAFDASADADAAPEAGAAIPAMGLSWMDMAAQLGVAAEASAQGQGISSLPPAAAVSGDAAWPAQVIIIRHAEKPAEGNDLSPRGEERAQALVGFFEHNPAVTRYGPPAAVYAMTPKADGHDVRPLETVEPLAQSLGLQVNTSVGKEDVEGLAQAVMKDPAGAGKMVLIAWEHHLIPAIAKAFGLTSAPETWPDDVFDRAWIINFDGGKPVSFQNVPQHLLPGDSSN